MMLPTKTRQYSYPERGSYNNLLLHEVPLAAPKANEVLVRTHAVSLQYRDLLITKTDYPGFVQPNLVPCSDMAGEVIAVGGDVTQWKAGDRVSANFALDWVNDEITPEITASSLGGKQQGVLTEYRSFPAHSLVAIAAHLSYEEASTLPCAGVTAYNALTASDTVLVLGTGGVSTFALQFAVAYGATVIALSSSDKKLDSAKKLGAKHVINYKTTPNWDVEVVKLTNGVGVDRVIEVTGNATLQRSIASVKLGGSIDLIGYLGGPNVPPVDVVSSGIYKGLKLRGILVGSAKQFKALNKLLEANPDATRPVIDRVFPFEQAKDAFAYFEGRGHVGKVVIKV
ncbi:alcohol dehydrogenase superfamily protein [Mycena capillaripes]|nr:alcohol dehydrogenase superfamily protein [Mycena capillaripes]